MRNKKKNFFYYLKKIFTPFDLFRKIILNLIFWVIFLFLIISPFIDSNIKLTGNENTLVINIQGTIVEELTGSSLSRSIGEYGGVDMSETLLWDILQAIELAENDKRINSILLDFRYMGNAGLAALTEIREALQHFQSNGKKIISYSDYLSQGQYYLASVSDEIYLDPMGELLITGFSVYQRYYGEGLERLGVDVNYFHAGKYKSYGEVYTRSSMSEPAKEENRKWSENLWNEYVSTISGSRNLTVADFINYINNYVNLLEKAGGSTVQTALDAGLIDGMLKRDELRSHMIEISGYSSENDSFNQIFFDSYLMNKSNEFQKVHKEKVAIITASGSIYNGYEDPGNIGGDTLSGLLETVLFDSSYKALVLRIDSGGGSAFASEIIRRQLERLRESEVPVVISMGSVAASGGYWMATASDEIWAHPTTLTGSIGVFSLITTFEDPLNKYLGVNVDGVGTTWMAGSMRSDMDLDPQVGRIFQSSVDNTYNQFLKLVGDSRDLSINEVNEIAQGRVWSGSDAHEIGLVDFLGGLSDAVDSAALLAGLNENEYNAVFIKQEIPLSNQLINSFLNSSVVEKINKNLHLFQTLTENTVIKKLKELDELKDPSGIYALSAIMFE